jgi:hypothetical protein
MSSSSDSSFVFWSGSTDYYSVQCSLLILFSVADPGCLSRIPDPDGDFLPSRIPDPGSRGQKSTQSRIPDPGYGSATLILLIL